jgi:DNA-directed RNA polymerase subunit A'
MDDKNKPKNITYFSKLTDLSFYVLSSEEVLSDSNVHITNKEIMKNEKPAPDSLYDSRMGTTDFSWNCGTCGNQKAVCPGHFGSIDLRYPVKSPMFRDELLKWLKITCYNCGEIVVKSKLLVPPVKRLSELVKNVKNIKECPYCAEPHMQVVKDKKKPFIFWRVQEESKKITKKIEFYNHHIKTVLERIRPDSVIKQGKPLRSHPRNFILTTIAAPPNTIRPDIRRLGGSRSSNSDTTSLMKTIFEINQMLAEEIPEDDQITQPMKDAYANLDLAYFSMVKGGGGGDVKMIANTSKPAVAIAERFPKKQGRIRRNLMGKRVAYMMRSVITGDSRLKINEVGIPMIHARDLEIPEKVTVQNRERLTRYFNNGTKQYPGCKHIVKATDGNIYRRDLLDVNYKLNLGDTVMRDMITGDYVAFNRQPSIIFTSIAGMRAIVMEVSDTLRLNPSCCSLFNADFDGDLTIFKSFGPSGLVTNC